MSSLTHLDFKEVKAALKVLSEFIEKEKLLREIENTENFIPDKTTSIFTSTKDVLRLR